MAEIEQYSGPTETWELEMSLDAWYRTGLNDPLMVHVLIAGVVYRILETTGGDKTVTLRLTKGHSLVIDEIFDELEAAAATIAARSARVK